MLFAEVTLSESEDHQHHNHHAGHQHHNMQLNTEGMVMHSNRVELPRDCESISRHHQFTVYAGAQHARMFPDKVFGYSDYQLEVEPCSLVEVTFVNEDSVRHQWMVHGLPRYLYGQGMFHLEAAGGESVSGAFIVPGDDKTYLIHCDIAQHMEKGMKAQLVVGRGSGDLWAIPGVSADFVVSDNLPEKIWLAGLALLVLMTLISAIVAIR